VHTPRAFHTNAERIAINARAKALFLGKFAALDDYLNDATAISNAGVELAARRVVRQ
jgi:hypothetical protein